MGSKCSHSTNEQSAVGPLGQQTSIADEKENGAICEFMQDSENQERRVIKILLLGSGSSGKSTFFRQLDLLYGEASRPGHTYPNVPYITRTIRSNCINGLFKLLMQSIRLCEKPFEFDDVKINIESQETQDSIKLLATFAKDVTLVPTDEQLLALGFFLRHIFIRKSALSITHIQARECPSCGTCPACARLSGTATSSA